MVTLFVPFLDSRNVNANFVFGSNNQIGPDPASFLSDFLLSLIPPFPTSLPNTSINPVRVTPKNEPDSGDDVDLNRAILASIESIGRENGLYPNPPSSPIELSDHEPSEAISSSTENLDLASEVSVFSDLGSEPGKEKSQPALKQPLVDSVKTEPLPENNMCTLMGTDIPAEYKILINQEPFDIRYFVKAMISQSEVVNPFTRGPLESRQLEAICSQMGISPRAFSTLDHYNNAAPNPIDQLVRALELRLRLFHLARLPANAENNAEYQRVQAQLERLDRNGSNSSRTDRLCVLLDEAATQGRITPAFAIGFKEILKEGAAA